jgi:dTDP-4-dehydrorhamnose 3,5-epimerase
MRVIATSIPDLIVLEPRAFGDERGYFFESWHKARYEDAGIVGEFVQDNISRSPRGILRGLHLQHPFAQGKLVQVLDGEVFDVAVDVRVGSPTFGHWHGEALSAENKRQMFVPPGFAHGFYVVSEHALFSYKCTALYHPETELSVAWNDPAIGIRWPLQGAPVLSGKDARAAPLAALAKDRLPLYRSTAT